MTQDSAAKDVLGLLGFIPNVTCLKDYEPYRHSSLFLQTRYKQLPTDRKGLPVALPEMMTAAGYKKRLKFLTRMKEQWLHARGSIPLAFIEHLGICREDLLWMLEFDREDFCEALKHADHPRAFTYRIMPCVYPSVRFPKGISEQAAIDYVRDFMKGQPDYIQRSGAWFTYDGIKTVFILEDGGVDVDYYEPDIIFERGLVLFRSARIPGYVSIR